MVFLTQTILRLNPKILILVFDNLESVNIFTITPNSVDAI